MINAGVITPGNQNTLWRTPPEARVLGFCQSGLWFPGPAARLFRKYQNVVSKGGAQNVVSKGGAQNVALKGGAQNVAPKGGAQNVVSKVSAQNVAPKGGAQNHPHAWG